jgi:lipopolysaccharide heptosyltransferase II
MFRFIKNCFKRLLDLFIFLFCIIGKIVFSVYFFFFPVQMVSNPKRILILDFDGSKLGDQVIATSLIRPLKKKFPDSEIYWFCSYITQDVFKNNPLLKEIIVGDFVDFKAFFNFFKLLELRKLKPDIVISLSYNLVPILLSFFSGAKIRIGFNYLFKGFSLTNPLPYFNEVQRKEHVVFFKLDLLKPLGIYVEKPMSEIYSSNVAKQKIKKLLPKTKNLFCIHAGSADLVKRSWPEKNFSELINSIASNKNYFFLVGSNQEKIISENIVFFVSANKKKFILDLTGKLSIDELIALMEKCKFFIGNDSAPMHLAAAVGCEVFAFFGPKNPVWFSPLTSKKHVFYHHLGCGPCGYETPKCKLTKNNRTHCIDSITVEEVLFEIKKVI